MNNFLEVHNLKWLSKKQTYYKILKAFSSDTPQSIKCQNNGPKAKMRTRIRQNKGSKVLSYFPSCSFRP